MLLYNLLSVVDLRERKSYIYLFPVKRGFRCSILDVQIILMRVLYAYLIQYYTCHESANMSD
jgi:hypothetical protein